MPKRPSLLNVRDTLQHVVQTCEDMKKRDGKYDGGVRLAPIDHDNLAQLSFICRAILRKHETKNLKLGQRKDVYVEAE